MRSRLVLILALLVVAVILSLIAADLVATPDLSVPGAAAAAGVGPQLRR